MRVAKDTNVEDIKIGAHTRANIVVGVPSLGMVPIEFVVAFARLQMPINGSCQAVWAKGMEVGVARNYIAEQAITMNSDPKFLFFLGDDMIPPWNGLISLHEEMELGKWDVLSGLYYMKSEPPTPIVWRNDRIGKMIPGIHFKVGEVVWCDVTGLDFTLIRMDVFKKIKPPYFKTGPTLNAAGAIIYHTEDVWFLDKCKEAGLRVGVHTGIRVAHLDVKSGMIY